MTKMWSDWSVAEQTCSRRQGKETGRAQALKDAKDAAADASLPEESLGQLEGVLSHR